MTSDCLKLERIIQFLLLSIRLYYMYIHQGVCVYVTFSRLGYWSHLNLQIKFRAENGVFILKFYGLELVHALYIL